MSVALKREKSIDFVVGTAVDTFFNVKVSRIVPGRGGVAYMKAEVHCSDDVGNYDPEMKVLDIDGIDTFELQVVLVEMKKAIAELTGVHV